MLLQEMPIYTEVSKIINSGPKPVHYSWTAIIHTPTENIDAFKTLSIDIDQDFEFNFGDYVLLTLTIPNGTYLKRIYPYKNNLEISLIKRPLSELTQDQRVDENNKYERFTAVLVDTGSPLIDNNRTNINTEEILNHTGFATVKLQLLPKALSQLRLILVGGIYNNTTLENIVKYIFTTESKKITLEEEYRPLGINVYPFDNQTKYKQIAINHGVPLSDLISYLHGVFGGLYSTGVGQYYLNRYWYVYPTYNTNRFDESNNPLTIINLPEDMFTEIERTYRVVGNSLYVISTGATKFEDRAEYLQLNEGEGVRFADANKILDSFVDVANNKIKAKRIKQNTEVVAVERNNNLKHVPISKDRIVATPFLEQSKIASRNGSYFNLVWENSKPELLTPGMAVKIIYMENDTLKEVYGVLLKAHTYVHIKGQAMFSNKHYNNTYLRIFVNRKKMNLKK